ncbi:MAG: ribosome biogenesis GTPase Der [Bacteroidetes bacterium]|nr:ribosome biogenesis GTPase Der [Bacteroidota bacterium]MDA0904566.1 ribosome biogenesis GTPase Der [Bacteroidota bacterium]MDA1243295.1 ribosome biogenesis GTPase Der [Bacteroidota bacterium]
MNNLVAIVGRPNVGKSTLFNRLTETREAITDDTSGTTRDRKYGRVLWTEHEFNVIDTGGWITNSEDSFEAAIRGQVEISLEEADVVLFMVEIGVGITDLDLDIANLLRRTGKPVFVVCNKVDTGAHDVGAEEFYALGLADQIFSISANNGYGTGELLDALVAALPPLPEQEDLGLPKLAVVGKPNVGKSTFINTILGEERNIVTDIAGTTRDSVHTRYQMFGFDFEIVDTAGLRKKRQITDHLEFYSSVRTIKAIDESDVCLLMLDGNDPMGRQDLNIFWQIVESYRGVVIVVNKWDRVDKDHGTMMKVEEAIRSKIAPFTDVPIVFTSNVTKQRVLKALEMALEVRQARASKISTSELNDVLLPIIDHYPPPALKGKYVKIKYVTQIKSQTPTFAFFCNLPQYIKDPYKRFLENQMREHYNFSGVPIRLFFRKK